MYFVLHYIYVTALVTKLDKFIKYGTEMKMKLSSRI